MTASEFSRGKRGAVLKSDSGKVRITIRLDADIIEYFKGKVLDAGGGNYQSLINEALRQHIEAGTKDLEKKLRKIIREELRKAG